MCHVLAKKRQLSIEKSSNQGLNKNCKNVRIEQILTNWIHHAVITLLHWWLTPNRKWFDTSIWIVTNVFLVAIFFQLPLCTICVNMQISKAVMETAFESVQSITTTNMPAANIMNHAFSYFIETIDMHCKLAIRYSPILTPYAAINYFIHSQPFHL